jgi:ectoine hydroxylase-related dioxygenase (phytanoyl-CoA dioxygenase family)
MTTTESVTSEPGVFGLDQLDELVAYFNDYGYATLRGLLDEAGTAAMEAECVDAQERLTAGLLDDRYGTTILIEGDAGEKATAFANYVTHVQELSPAVLDTAAHPVVIDLVRRWVGDNAWLMSEARFGVVYQDARPGRESSYTRIGWHSDWQSGPNIDMWPSVAFTIHIDGTSPANGFLRVVPGSHKWATPAPYRNANDAVVPDGSAPWGGHTDTPAPFEMPLGFEKVPGEIAVYAERGDVLFHDCYLWHSAARATDDDTRRRHARGGWFSGAGPIEGDHVDDFVKNAAR